MLQTRVEPETALFLVKGEVVPGYRHQFLCMAWLWRAAQKRIGHMASAHVDHQVEDIPKFVYAVVVHITADQRVETEQRWGQWAAWGDVHLRLCEGEVRG